MHATFLILVIVGTVLLIAEASETITKHDPKDPSAWNLAKKAVDAVNKFVKSKLKLKLIKVGEYSTRKVEGWPTYSDIRAFYGKDIVLLCEKRRGIQKHLGFLEGGERVLLRYNLPLAEVIVDFFNQLKAVSSGFASFDYEPDEYQVAPLVKVTILLNNRCVEEFSTIVHKDIARSRGKEICEKLVDEIPRQQYPIKIQAAIGGKIIARTDIRAIKKNIAAKLKGNFGDASRLAKLVKNQRKGIEHRMKYYGDVQVPREAFINVVKR